jgi:ribonuclease P protein component
VVVHLREREDDAPARVAVVASRRVGSAVARNRAKRLLREASRTVAWKPGLDVVLVARAASVHSGLSKVQAELEELVPALEAVQEAA